MYFFVQNLKKARKNKELYKGTRSSDRREGVEQTVSHFCLPFLRWGKQQGGKTNGSFS